MEITKRLAWSGAKSSKKSSSISKTKTKATPFLRENYERDWMSNLSKHTWDAFSVKTKVTTWKAKHALQMGNTNSWSQSTHLPSPATFAARYLSSPTPVTPLSRNFSQVSEWYFRCLWFGITIGLRRSPKVLPKQPEPVRWVREMNGVLCWWNGSGEDWKPQPVFHGISPVNLTLPSIWHRKPLWSNSEVQSFETLCISCDQQNIKTKNRRLSHQPDCLCCRCDRARRGVPARYSCIVGRQFPCWHFWQRSLAA